MLYRELMAASRSKSDSDRISFVLILPPPTTVLLVSDPDRCDDCAQSADVAISELASFQ